MNCLQIVPRSIAVATTTEASAGLRSQRENNNENNKNRNSLIGRKLKSGLFAAILFCVLPSSVFSVTFDASKKLSPIHQPQISGTCLPVWNTYTTYKQIKKGLALSHYATMRYPNGTLSNEFHWNSKGTLDSSGIWHPDTAVDSGDFQSTNRYCGTTSSNYGTTRYSRVMDGDTNSFWWSDPLITESDPYISVNWKTSQSIDSVVILWGDRYSKSFEVQTWKGSVSYPGTHQMPENMWKTVYSKDSATGGCSKIKFDVVSTSSMRVISHTGLTGKDIQIREIYGYSNGVQVTSNLPDNETQNRVFALSTHPGVVETSSYQWTFDTFMNYLDTLGYPTIPVICTNYGTGTPEEAAAWVYYANKVKKYNIRYWQVGNEMDGEWEIGGPVNAFTYAEKFIKYSKAMKAVDPTIKVLGPLASSLDKLSGEYDNKSWLESVIFKIGESEKRDNCKYIDGIDFHSYPYWTPSITDLKEMALASDYVFNQSDSMLTWINRYLENPDSTMVMMSEFNASVVMSSAIKKPINAVVVANMNAGLAYKFGYRAMSVIWDSYEGGEIGPDGTHGALTLFNYAPSSIIASMKPTPSSAFWGNFLVTNIWLDPYKDNFLIESDSSRAGSLRYYGNATSGDSRVLVLNLSTTDTLNVNVNMARTSDSNVQVYTWGEREFNLHGTNSNAYAMPNCGPSSYNTTVNNLGTPKIGPLCAMVLRYYHSDTARTIPERIFWTSVNSRSKPGDTIGVSVSYRVTQGTIKTISYKLDTASYQNASALDGRFDGPYENSFLTFDSKKLGDGNFKLIVRAQSSAGDTAFDTLTFMGYASIKRPQIHTGLNNQLIITNLSSGNIRISYKPVRSGVSYIKVYKLSGELVREFTSKAGMPLNIVWDDKSIKGESISSGLLLVKAGIKGMKSEESGIFRVVK
jgi:hypothetical protein